MKGKLVERNLRHAIAYRAKLGCGKGFKHRRHAARWLCCDWNMGRGKWYVPRGT